MAGRISFVFNWLFNASIRSKHLMNAIRDIGASGGDLAGGWDQKADVPCRCRTRDGRMIEHCVISFFKRIPREWQRESYELYAGDIEEFYPSEFALPKEVRDTSKRAVEIRMMFAPTPVKTLDGKLFLLNGGNYFFDYEGARGKDISLDRRPTETIDAYKVLLVNPEGDIGYWGGPSLRSEFPLTWILAKPGRYRKELFPQRKW